MQKRLITGILLVMTMVLTSACAQTQLATHYAKKWRNEQEPQKGNYKIGKPYQIENKWYYPEEKFNYTETGIASWYGPGFHGKRTANGELFDENELTAAHRTLQMPSLVRVTNLENGRTIVVRVNDRGPFSKGRVMDLSKRSAELLGFRDRGTAKIKLEVLENESLMLASAAKAGQDTTRVAMKGYQAPPQPQQQQQQQVAVLKNDATVIPGVPGHTRDGRFLPEPVVVTQPVKPSDIYVQAGAFTVIDNARNLEARLAGIAPVKVMQALVRGQNFYRVRLGPMKTVKEADMVLAQVMQAGNSAARIVVE